MAQPSPLGPQINPATGKWWTSRELMNAVLDGSMTLRAASRHPSLAADQLLPWTAEERSRIPEQAWTFEDFKWDTMQDLRAGITAGTITPMQAYRLSGRYEFVTEVPGYKAPPLPPPMACVKEGGTWDTATNTCVMAPTAPREPIPPVPMPEPPRPVDPRDPPPQMCPAGSAREGQALPQGMPPAWCFDANGVSTTPVPQEPVCPVGTPREGQPVPPGAPPDFCMGDTDLPQLCAAMGGGV